MSLLGCELFLLNYVDSKYDYEGNYKIIVYYKIPFG